VLVNVSDIGSHALVVSGTGVESIPLPELQAFDAQRQARAFYTAVETARNGMPRTSRLAAETAISEVLGWLWDMIAEPVLGHLGYLGQAGPGQESDSQDGHSQDGPTRLWWSATGALGMLPLHAAAPRCGPGVLDLVTSSYTPTIRALAHARRQADAVTGEPGGRRALGVFLPETPGCRDLPGAADELDLLTEVFGAALDVLTGPQATREAVLSGLPGHAFAHFACHAMADPASPSSSRLLVHDHQQQAFTVSEVMKLDLPAEFAFLSACETARTGPALTDESIHLGSAFQIAGFRHVVATLWPVSDRQSVRMARALYQAVRDAGSTAAVPVALHREVRRLRAAWPDDPSVWAVYVHSGA
jgi:hypothetical protein